MGRSSKVEECMFCGEVPCACDGPPKPKKAAAKKRKVVETVTSILDDDSTTEKPISSIRAAMKATASESPKGDIEALAQAARDGWANELLADKVVQPDDPEMDAAILVLIEAGMIHPEEVERYEHLVRAAGTSPPGLDDGLDEWKSWYAQALQEKRERVPQASNP